MHLPPIGTSGQHRVRWMPGTGAEVAEGAPIGAAYAVAAPTGFDDSVDVEDPDAVNTAPTRIPSKAELSKGRPAAVDTAEDAAAQSDEPPPGAAARPAIHLPLADPHQVPDGYPIKANASLGLYYTPDNELYEDTLAEIWFASEEVARANGFNKAS